MSGTHAIRGFNFQAAITVHVALDVLEAPQDHVLQVEGDLDAVDYEVERDGQLLRVGQVKGKQEPGVWQPAELTKIVNGLAETKAANAHLEFVSDATLGAAAWGLNQAIARMGQGTATADDIKTLKQYGLDSLGNDVLRRVRLDLRRPQTSDLIDLAAWRLFKLFRQRGQILEPKGATDKITLLFAETLLKAADEKSRRRLTTANLAAVVDLPAQLPSHPPLILEYRPQEPFVFLPVGGSTTMLRIAVRNQSSAVVNDASLAVDRWRWEGANGEIRTSTLGERLRWSPAGEIPALNNGQVLPRPPERIRLDPQVTEWVCPLMVGHAPSRLILRLPNGPQEFTGAGRLWLSVVVNDAQRTLAEYQVAVDWTGKSFREAGPSGLPGVAVG